MTWSIDVRQQPAKALYLTSAVLQLLIVLLPWWTVRNALPTWRPRRSWPLSWCLKTNSAKHLIEVFKKTGEMPAVKALDKRPGILGLYIDAASPTYIVGKLKEWADHAGVSPVQIAGYWVHGARSTFTMGQKPSQKEKVLLYLHGGAYVAFSAHPDSPTGIIPKSLIRHCQGVVTNVKRALCVEYRLSGYDPVPRENPFPAALLDALAAYAYLVDDVGFAPENVVVVGDSAGGNLALALVRYLVEQSRQSEVEGWKLKAPGAMILLSPWCDLGRSNSEDTNNTMHTNTSSDYLVRPVILPNGRARHEYQHYAFAGAHGVDFLDRNVYTSPSSLFLEDCEVRFEGFPRTFVDYGGAETLADQIKTLVRRMRKDMGDRLVYHEAKDAVHDYTWIEWQAREGELTLRIVRDWITSL